VLSKPNIRIRKKKTPQIISVTRLQLPRTQRPTFSCQSIPPPIHARRHEHESSLMEHRLIEMVLPSKVTRPNMHVITNGRQAVKIEVIRGEIRSEVELAVLMFYSMVVELYSVQNFF